MVLEGPLIHHLEVSKQGFVLADLPFKTIWGNQHCTLISPFKTTIANGFKWCINLYEKGTKSRRVNVYLISKTSILIKTVLGIITNAVPSPFATVVPKMPALSTRYGGCYKIRCALQETHLGLC